MAHELLHAYQVQVQERWTDDYDLIEMEVEAKNLGLEIYRETGHGPDYMQHELEIWNEGQKNYDNAVRDLYYDAYGIDKPSDATEDESWWKFW